MFISLFINKILNTCFAWKNIWNYKPLTFWFIKILENSCIFYFFNTCNNRTIWMIYNYRSHTFTQINFFDCIIQSISVDKTNNNSNRLIFFAKNRHTIILKNTVCYSGECRISYIIVSCNSFIKIWTFWKIYKSSVRSVSIALCIIERNIFIFRTKPICDTMQIISFFTQRKIFTFKYFHFRKDSQST